MKIQIQKKIIINKEKQNVYTVIADLTKWNVWSPWMHNEPTAKTHFSGSPGQIGQYQTWEGEVIGSGKMTVEALEKNSSVKIKLEFFTPWKSLASVVFDIVEYENKQSQVTWTMNSHLPFFMFFFKKMMIAYLGSDFDRGLKMLKEFVETGEVISKSVYVGEKDFSGFKVVGKKTESKISDLSVSIPADFKIMEKRLKNGELTQPDAIITLSHKHDIPNGTSLFTAGYLYNLNHDLKVPNDLEIIKLPDHKGLVVDHFGPYRNIGNPWSMAASYQRGKKKKLAKKIPMYEMYKTMPDGRSEKEIHTQIIIPIK